MSLAVPALAASEEPTGRDGEDHHDREVARQTVSGLAWTLSLGWGARILQLFGTLLLTYFIDPSAMGEVTNAAVLVMSADRFSRLGVGGFLVTRRDPARDLIWHASVLVALTGLLTLGVVSALGGPFGSILKSPHLSRYLPGLAAAALLTRMGMIPERLLQGRMEFRAVSVARGFSEVTYAVAAVGLAVGGAGALAVVGGNLARSVLYLLLMSRRIPAAHWLTPAPFSREAVRSIFRFGVPLSVSHLLSVMSRSWDNLVVSAMFGSGVVGHYNVAYNLADIPATQIGEHVSDVLTPSLVRLDGERRRRALIRWLGIISLAVFPAAIGLGVVAPTLVHTALPARWAAVGPMLAVLSLIGVLRPIGWAIESYLQAGGRTRILMGVSILHVAALFTAIWALGTLGGPLWACLGVGVGFAVYAGAYAIVLARTEGVRWVSLFDSMARPLAACAVMAVSVLGTRAALEAAGLGSRGGDLVLEIVVGMVTYLGACRVVARPILSDALFLLRDAWSRRTSADRAAGSDGVSPRPMTEARGPLRVLQVVASLSLGGAERVALEVAAGLRSRGLAVDLLRVGPEAPGSDYERSVEDEALRRGVPVHRVPFVGPFHRATRRSLAEFLVEGSYDVVHVHNRPQDWQIAVLGRLMGIRVVYSVHLPYELDRLRQRILYAASARAVPAVVCVSQSVASHVRESERVPGDRLRVIYNGIRTDVFAPLPPPERVRKRAELEWAEDDFVWLCAARLSAQKGHEYLIAAMAALPPSSRARLVLAGDGPLREDLVARVSRAGLDDRVRFLGARRDVPSLLGAADGYACGSLQEGHPLAVLEAMAVGLPVVAPRLPVIVEIASEGGPLLFGPSLAGAAPRHEPDHLADAMAAVERDAASFRRRASDLRADVARRFSFDAMVDAHADLYRTLAADPRPIIGGRVRRRVARWL